MRTNVIVDQSGKHRLTMRFAAEGNGANFHSLIWEVSDGATWSGHIVITRADFQPPTKHRRWVTKLHSFDPDAGRAIIQVAEGDVPVGTPTVNYTYSWREWDLRHNREIRFLSICKTPSDKYEPSA